MSDRWDFYFTRVDDHPASIFVDMGLEQEAPVDGFGHMAWIRLYLLDPAENGMSRDSEYGTLLTIEKTLEACLHHERHTRYVGRDTTAGFREFVFYTSMTDGWHERASFVLADFPDYGFETGVREDLQWDVYFRFLLPSDEDRQCMSNRQACDALRERGDDLSAGRAIDHWLYFPNAPSRDAFVQRAVAKGFRLQHLLDPQENNNRHGAHVQRHESDVEGSIDQVTIDLLHLAREHGGDYDGWEASVVRSGTRQ